MDYATPADTAELNAAKEMLANAKAIRNRVMARLRKRRQRALVSQEN